LNYFLQFLLLSYCYYLEFAFPLCEEAYRTLYFFHQEKTKFLNPDFEEQNDMFKNILKITLRCGDVLGIDGYIEVDNFTTFRPYGLYEDLNNLYFINKTNIFMTQINIKRKDFDFCIYQPNNNALILIRAEYCIRNGKVSAFSS